MTPGDLYRNISVSAHRLESQPHYAVPDDDERQRAFLAGEPLPPPRLSKQEDLHLIAALRAAGKTIERVHVVDRPLSNYTRYELAVYPENVAAGEDVYIADRTVHSDLADLRDDLVVFDPGTPAASVIIFDLDDTGAVVGYRHAVDGETVRRCWQQYQVARRHAVALEDFTAGARGTAR